MGFTPNTRRMACLALVPLIISAWIAAAMFHAARAVHADQAQPSARTIQLGAARAGEMYAVTVSVKDLAQLQGAEAVHATINDGHGEVESKWLHPADLDFYLTLRPRAAGPVTVNLSAPSDAQLRAIVTSMVRIPDSPPAGSVSGRGVIAAAPNSTWQTAQSFELGQTIFGSDDQRPYAPSPSEDAYAAMLKGFQWF